MILNYIKKIYKKILCYIFSNDSNNVLRDGYIWNMIASVINASEAIIILMIASRCLSIFETGILSIAFTIANLMLTMGKFGMRNYQATDQIQKNNFLDYFHSRLITVVIMILLYVIYIIIAILKGYTYRKVIIISFVVFIYAIEAVEDVFLSGFQQKGRLDIGAKIFCVRWIATLIVWGSMLAICRDSLYAVVVSFLVEIVVSFLLLHKSWEYLCESDAKCYIYNVFNLIKECTPLALSGFIAYYITNASKYAIDACLTDDVQACYGFVAMPIFVIGLLNSIIYQPILVKMSMEWMDNRIYDFIKRIIRQLVYIFVISLVCMVWAWILGIPVLSVLYSIDLQEYKMELMILLLGGAWLAFAGFFAAIITIMRKQKLLLFIYCLVAVIAFLLSNPITKTYGVLGAAFSNMIWTFLEALILGIIVLYNILIEKRG